MCVLYCITQACVSASWLRELSYGCVKWLYLACDCVIPHFLSIMPHLSQMQRDMIVGAYLMCHNILLVSQTLKLPYSTVHRWITRYEQSKSVARKPGSGRPRRTSAHSDRLLYRLARTNGFASSSELLRHWQRGVSTRTVLRRLHERHLRQCRPCRVPLLTKEHKRARLD